jgi:hypothetical protein
MKKSGALAFFAVLVAIAGIAVSVYTYLSTRRCVLCQDFDEDFDDDDFDFDCDDFDDQPQDASSDDTQGAQEE